VPPFFFIFSNNNVNCSNLTAAISLLIKIMKSLLLLPICTLFFLVSCKKSTPITPQSSISATVDGINKTFNINTEAALTNIEGTGNVLVISGKATSETDSDIIGLEVNSASAITKGSYPVTTGIAAGFDAATSISYIQGYETFWPAVSAVSPNSITITYISSTNVQGTFNVALSGGTLSTSPIITNKTITNGKFNVSIKPSN
jgi:hypothetical protein